MSIFQWVMQDLHSKKIEIALEKQQEENVSEQQVLNIPPTLSKELRDFITRMQQNLGMRVEYGPLDNAKEEETQKQEKNGIDYTTEIETLEYFFSNCTLPNTPIQLSKHERILNVKDFIESHLSTIKNYANNKYYGPYLERLQRLKIYLSQMN